MNLTKILAATCIAAITLMCACSDDSDSKPKESLSKGQFSFDTLDLKGANLYMNWEGTEDGRRIRLYFITDATFADGLGEYTFLLALYLVVPEDSTVKTGNYPIYKTLSQVPLNERAGILSLQDDQTGIDYTIPDGVVKGTPIIISGGIEPGETMKVQFNGTLMHVYQENGTEKKENIAGTLSFQGKVQAKNQ